MRAVLIFSNYEPKPTDQLMRMNPSNNNKTNITPKRRNLLPGACVLAVAAAACMLVAGCETFRAWGEKSSSTPGMFGGSMSIPLGKK